MEKALDLFNMYQELNCLKVKQRNDYEDTQVHINRQIEICKRRFRKFITFFFVFFSSRKVLSVKWESLWVRERIQSEKLFSASVWPELKAVFPAPFDFFWSSGAVLILVRYPTLLGNVLVYASLWYYMWVTMCQKVWFPYLIALLLTSSLSFFFPADFSYQELLRFCCSI